MKIYLNPAINAVSKFIDELQNIKNDIDISYYEFYHIVRNRT